MIAGVLLTAVAFLFHIQNDTLPSRIAVQQRETLERMMVENRREFPGADEIDVVEVAELMTQKNCVLFDVRTEAERSVSIIPGAVSAAEFERAIGDHAGKTVVCYCTIRYRSAKYVQSMKQRCVSISSFNGSIIAWCQAGHNLTTAEGHTTMVHVYGPKWNLIPPDYQALR